MIPTARPRFIITVDGQTPAPFDPKSGVPNIVAKQGDVEDWIIENRSNELHAFHIHQLHFLLLDYLGTPVNEPFLRDTVNVPYYNGRTLEYPSVRLRMDFRDPNTVGTFVYHCHLLEHEDGGMMGLIRVEPAEQAPHHDFQSREGSKSRFTPRGHFAVRLGIPHTGRLYPRRLQASNAYLQSQLKIVFHISNHRTECYCLPLDFLSLFTLAKSFRNSQRVITLRPS